MSVNEQTVTFRNLVNMIDCTVLKLKEVKRGDEFSSELKTQIRNIFNFTIESNKDAFSDVLHNKSVYIEFESLKKLHNNLSELKIPREELERVSSIINKLESNNVDQIDQIQTLLVQISIPIWNTSQQLANE